MNLAAEDGFEVKTAIKIISFSMVSLAKMHSCISGENNI